MINLLIGPPGGGKSYEATVFHILPALREGRKVITNLPLLVEMFGRLDPAYPALIELKTVSNDGKSRPFSHLSDYGDPWRHPETGTGPLYVIDEAHECLPKGGLRKPGTPPEIGEWFATHRHEFADVLIITQAYGRVSADVTDRIQLVYRVKKKTAFGQPDWYIRKVQDGLRGEVVDLQERQYEKQYFCLYTSHTKSSIKGIEAGASDVTPRFKKFIRMGIAVVVASLAMAACNGVMAWNKSNDKKKSQPKPVSVASVPAALPASAPAGAAVRPVASAASAVDVAQAANVQPENTPFEGLVLHVSAFLESGTKRLYLFTLSQNGQGIAQLTTEQVRESGYSITPVSSCVVKLQYGENKPFFARCDAPQINLMPAGPGGAQA